MTLNGFVCPYSHNIVFVLALQYYLFYNFYKPVNPLLHIPKSINDVVQSSNQNTQIHQQLSLRRDFSWKNGKKEKKNFC